MVTKRDLTSETAEDKFDVEAEARRRGIEPYQVRASQAVPTKLVADIVADFRNGPSPPSSMASRPQSPAPATRGNGWQDPAPLKGPDTRWVDAQLDQADRLARIAAIRQAAENAWIESHFQKGPRIETEYEPFDRENLKK